MGSPKQSSKDSVAHFKFVQTRVDCLFLSQKPFNQFNARNVGVGQVIYCSVASLNFLSRNSF